MKHIYSVLFLLVFCSISYSQNPCPGVPTVDYGGKTYNTVQIGSQCWLKENLDVGTRINNGTSGQTNNSEVEKYCYNDSIVNCDIYGGLYQWDEAMQYVTTEGAQGICPTGWHIPTWAEFQTLATTVNNNSNALVMVGQGTGTNTSGFSALFAGFAGFDYDFFDFLGGSTRLWSSSGDSAVNVMIAYSMLLASYSNVGYVDDQKKMGLSVRCLKD